MSAQVSYSHRFHVYAQQRIYRLTDDALIWEDEDGGSGRLAYADITRVHLAYRPSRAQPDRFLATIASRSGERVRISNTSYRGFNDFIVQDAEYSSFLKALHARLSEGGYEVSFRKGSGFIGFSLNLVLTIVITGGLAALAVYMLWGGYYGLAAAKLLIVAWYMPVLFRFMKRSVPVRYTPDAIPDDGLPWAGRSMEAKRAG
ncbi:MAG: hypothetical protein R3D43_02185 [Tepidamorphaceae bacterium]|nr:hypothetical protein [Rhodobiaceae bacterium]MCC0049578.1 hypothetical protein [Rhodobiaceae bacterium]